MLSMPRAFRPIADLIESLSDIGTAVRASREYSRQSLLQPDCRRGDLLAETFLPLQA